MQEVTIRLRFNRECLGSVKKRKSLKGQNPQVVFCFARDPSGRIMFLPTWWASLLSYSAKVANRAFDIVNRIDWDPIVDGKPKERWKRVVVPAHADPKGRERYALHEAFPPGAVIGINAVIPRGLSVDEFEDLLTIAGTYRGISPFREDNEKYGTFEVLSVNTTVRNREKSKTQST